MSLLLERCCFLHLKNDLKLGKLQWNLRALISMCSGSVVSLNKNTTQRCIYMVCRSRLLVEKLPHRCLTGSLMHLKIWKMEILVSMEKLVSTFVSTLYPRVKHFYYHFSLFNLFFPESQYCRIKFSLCFYRQALEFSIFILTMLSVSFPKTWSF